MNWVLNSLIGYDMITAEQLRCKVRQLINESNDDAAVTLLTDDTKMLDRHIDALMPDAVLLVQRNKAVGAVNPKSAVAAAVPDENDGAGYILLPDDFVQLLSLRMSGWSAPCRRVYAANSQVALMQHNRYTRSGGVRPVCSEDILPSGERCLRYWWLPKGEQPVVEHFIYEARYDAVKGLSGDDEALHKAVAYYCAALLMNIFGRGDMAAVFMNTAAALCTNVEHTNEKQ